MDEQGEGDQKQSHKYEPSFHFNLLARAERISLAVLVATADPRNAVILVRKDRKVFGKFLENFPKSFLPVMTSEINQIWNSAGSDVTGRKPHSWFCRLRSTDPAVIINRYQTCISVEGAVIFDEAKGALVRTSSPGHDGSIVHPEDRGIDR